MRTVPNPTCDTRRIVCELSWSSPAATEETLKLHPFPNRQRARWIQDTFSDPQGTGLNVGPDKVCSTGVIGWKE